VKLPYLFVLLVLSSGCSDHGLRCTRPLRPINATAQAARSAVTMKSAAAGRLAAPTGGTK